MGYRTRSDMFKADFAAGQSPFQSTGDISLSTAITDQILPLKGDFLYIDQASTGSVYVELNAKQGGTLAPVLLAAGGSIEIPDGGFDSIKINAAAQLNKSIRIIVGNGARIKSGGTVNPASNVVMTVNGARTRTDGDRAFASYQGQGALAGNYSHLQLFNPVGSGKTIYVEKVICKSTVAASTIVGSYSTALSVSLGTAPSKKIGSSTASVGQLRIQTNATQLITNTYGVVAVTASIDSPYDMSAPFALPPGNGLILVPTVVNQAVYGNIEWYEE